MPRLLPFTITTNTDSIKVMRHLGLQCVRISFTEEVALFLLHCKTVLLHSVLEYNYRFYCVCGKIKLVYSILGVYCKIRNNDLTTKNLQNVIFFCLFSFCIYKNWSKILLMYIFLFFRLILLWYTTFTHVLICFFNFYIYYFEILNHATLNKIFNYKYKFFLVCSTFLLCVHLM